MNRALFTRELRSSLGIAGIFSCVLAMYIGMIVSMFDPRLGKSLDEMAQSMPQMFAAFGMSARTTTLLGFMLNYLYGFLLTVLPFALIMMLTSRLVVRHLDRGTMAYLLATPNSRRRIVTTLAGVLLAVLSALGAVTMALEMGFAGSMLPGELDGWALARANAGLLAVWVFFAGACFASACTIPQVGAARWTGGGVCILFILMQMISQVGMRFDALKNVNPLSLFDFYGLAAGDAGACGRAALLAGAGAALFAVAVAVFDRRDLSV